MVEVTVATREVVTVVAVVVADGVEEAETVGAENLYQQNHPTHRL